MKIDKAIEILKYHTPKAPPYFDPDLVDAIKLGIEALKRLNHDRMFKSSRNLAPLPGEGEASTTTRSLHHIKAVLESPLGREPQG